MDTCKLTETKSVGIVLDVVESDRGAAGHFDGAAEGNQPGFADVGVIARVRVG